MKKNLVWLLLSLFCLNFSLWSALAAEDNRFEALAKLELSESQKQQIEKIKSDRNTLSEALRQDLTAKQAKLKTMLTGEAATDGEIQEQKRQIASLEERLTDLKVEYWLKAKQVLTIDQQAELRNMQLK